MVAIIARPAGGRNFISIRVIMSFCPRSAFDHCPSSIPTGLTATAVSSSQIDLQWQGDGTETEFRFEQALSPSGPWGGRTVEGGTRSYSLTGLRANTLVYFRVRACNAGGCSAYSDLASARTNGINTVPNKYIAPLIPNAVRISRHTVCILCSYCSRSLVI